MDKRGDIAKHSKGKLASGLMRGAVVSGVAAAMAAASLGEMPEVDATCVGILGISINDGSGGHCSASFFSFALGLGPGTSATAEGQSGTPPSPWATNVLRNSWFRTDRGGD